MIAASKNLVLVVGHAGAKVWDTTHGSREIKKGTEKFKVCKIYEGIVCEDHVEVFKDRTPPLFKNATFNMPHHLYFSPAGEELFRNWGSQVELLKDFETALAKVPGTHVAKGDYDAAKGQVAQGAALVKKDEIKKAIDVFTKLTNHKNELLRPLGTKELEALEASGNARYEAALQQMETQNGEEQAKKELKKLADEYSPFPCSKKAAEVLKLMAEKGR